MRKLLCLIVLLALPGLAGAQSSDFIRYYPAPVAGTSGGGATFTAPVKINAGDATTPSIYNDANGGNKYGLYFDPANFGMLFSLAGTRYLQWGATGVGLKSNTWLFWTSGEPGITSADLYLKRAAAGTLLQENADNPQFFRVSAGFSGYGEIGTATEEITLATGATTTDSTANLLPAGSIIEAVTYRVTTTITTAVNFSIGDATTVARFVSGATGVAAGSTGTGLLQNNPTAADAAGPVQSAAAKIRITTNANPGAGKIRVQVFYRFFGVPST